MTISQEVIADAAGVSQALISKFEKNKPIKPESESKIIEAYERVFSEFDRNSKQKTEHATQPAATQAPEMPHLTLVPQAKDAPANTPPAVDRALSHAFDAARHALADIYTIHPIAARLPLDGRTEGELVTTFRSYLDAAARLRGRGVQPTFEALFAELTFNKRE